MSKEIPILFSTPMVKAILEGRKTMTRRIVKPPYQSYPEVTKSVLKNEFDFHYPEGIGQFTASPYGKPGDLLWVRETWSPKYVKGCLEEFRIVYPDNYPWTYLADDVSAKAYGYGRPWRPSIHMPKAAARIWLEVTGVRVERLQNISPGDACDEGINYWNIDPEAMEGGELQADFENYTWSEEKENDPNYEDRYFPTFANPVDSFRSLWQSINGPESWEANSWVWVVSFKVLSTKGKP